MITAQKVDDKSVLAFRNVKRDVHTLFDLLLRTQHQHELLENEVKAMLRMQKVQTHALKTLVKAAQGLPKNIPTEVIVTKYAEPKLVASKNANRLHRENCAFAKHINRENIEVFENKIEAMTRGFKPCVCVA